MDSQDRGVLPEEMHHTYSVCPVCLKRIPAKREERDGQIYLVKTCPDHGTFSSVIWRNKRKFADWRGERPAVGENENLNCPAGCGLCAEHRRATCCTLLEITARCNMNCTFCFAEPDGTKDPSLDPVKRWIDDLTDPGKTLLQLSGGEPTVRDDLPEIVAYAKQAGCKYVQLNSNGLRLGRDPGYARALAEAGLDSVYLQFDGADDDVYRALRGRPCLDDKLRAVKACAGAGLGVVLVATVVRGVNLDKLGDLLRLALELGPSVRGLHLQPAASFGRFPWDAAAAPRVTLPETMRALAGQSGGLLSVTDFHPPGCEHALCSFSAVYRRTPEGLALIEGGGDCCAPSSRALRAAPVVKQAAASVAADGGVSLASPIAAEEGARVSRAFTARHWSAPPAAEEGSEGTDQGDDFDRFLARAGLARRFTVSGMAFQDALTLDLERVRGCCIHVVSPEGLLVPFCLYNLTALDGTPLYRGADRGVAGAERA